MLLKSRKGATKSGPNIGDIGERKKKIRKNNTSNDRSCK